MANARTAAFQQWANNMTGDTFANLQIIREIGHGGMGVVYEAQQQAPQRRVAVKVLPPHLASEPGVAARFADEANKMARLEGHPNIAQVYAAGQSDGVPYLVMQLLRGDLDQRLRTHGALPLSDAAELAAQVADGLDYAHERGVIHRDIKPANIMFDERGRPVVTDFGIAKAMDEYRLTSTGMTLGTPQYASPEQVRGKPLDGRSDL
ncbi:MAG: serine/threonine-protein kinase, partial [Armatimonadia bacterium]